MQRKGAKGFRSQKKMVKFSNKKCSVYRCTFVMQPVNTNQAQLKWPSIRNVQEKAKEKGGKDREKGVKNARSNHKNKKKKKKKKKESLCAYIFPP